MEKVKTIVVSVLIELRSAGMLMLQCRTAKGRRAIQAKYDADMLGAQFNILYSDALTKSMRSHFGYDISESEVLSVLPSACRSLGMHWSPFTNITEGRASITGYSIRLF